MKSQSTMECNTSQENGQDFSSGIGISREKQNCDDTEDDEDDDRNESTNITTSVADLCSASHEFEWLSPTSQGMSSYTHHHHHDKQSECGIFAELSTEHQSSNCTEEASPIRSSPQRSHKPAWPRRTADHLRMSPSPYNELHCCRRHLSPMRSSWCCPSPTPSVLCAHHAGPAVSNMELVPYPHSCCGPDISYCSCLPPTGLPHSPRYHESHTWCHNTSPHHETRRKESSSPCAMHRTCQGIAGSRKSRSTTPRKRNSSPIPLSPRYSPVPGEQSTIVRPSTNDPWQVAFHSEDINNLQKVQELESDKKNLILQASVLADQVDAQADKIAELERLLSQKKDNLIQLEHNLHQEVLARSAVENSKLELITELSNLRLRITAAERDRKDSDDKCRKLETEVFASKSRLIEMETEYAMLKGRLSRNVPHITSSEDACDFKHLKSLQEYMANDDKDQKLDDLRSSLTKYKKLQDIVLSTHNRKVADISSIDSHGFNSDSMSSSLNGCLTKHIKEIKETNQNAGRYSTLPSTSSISKQFNHSTLPSVNSSNISYSSSTILPTQKSNSVENIIPSNNILSNNQSDTSLHHTTSHLQEVDSRKFDSSNTEKESYVKENPVAIEHINSKSPGKKNAGGTGKSSGVSFGKGFFKLKSGKRSSSEPYLGDGFVHSFFWLLDAFFNT